MLLAVLFHHLHKTKEGRESAVGFRTCFVGLIGSLFKVADPLGSRRPGSSHPSVLATNREVKEGRAPFTPRFWRQAEIVKEGRAPFTLPFWRQTER